MSDNKQPVNLLQPEELNPAVEITTQVLAELDHVLLGRSALHRMVLIGILSQGHILLEGVPGVGKTALVKALGQLLSLDFNRVQFTPDLMPGRYCRHPYPAADPGGATRDEFPSGSSIHKYPTC